MSDQKLLEYAARAMGNRIPIFMRERKVYCRPGGWPYHEGIEADGRLWNPLTNAADGMELMLEVMVDVSFKTYAGEIHAVTGNGVRHPLGEDRHLSFLRAITLAAAKSAGYEE